MLGYKPRLPQLTPELRDEIVRRIVAVSSPDKIVLFGSRARGDYREHSDVDLLVIGPSKKNSYERVVPLYAAMSGIGIEVDIEIVAYTPEEVEEWRGASAALVTTALREGKTIYERQR